MRYHVVFVSLVVAAGLGSVELAASDRSVAGRTTKEIEGWTVLISDELLQQDRAATEKALELLQVQLAEIVRVVPKAAVDELRKVPLWFSAEYPGVPPRAEYHPEAGWLRDNKRDPSMAKAVEFTNVRTFERDTKRMPNFALHELAHAYHDRVLDQGFNNPDVKAAFEKVKSQGLYDQVEQRFGDGRSANVRAYAMTNPMEYFAESSEAYFSINDFFPFDRKQLARHDPEMLTCLQQLWNVNTPPAIQSPPTKSQAPAVSTNVASEAAERLQCQSVRARCRQRHAAFRFSGLAPRKRIRGR